MARNREKTAGRKDTRRFAGIPHVVMEHPDWFKLHPSAICLLMELAKQYNGHNNGDLTAAWSIMHKRGFNSQSTLGNALERLLEYEFIVKTREGRFCNPGKQCALYALTWQPINECNGKNLEVGPTQAPPRAFSLGSKNLSPKTGAIDSRKWSHKEG